MNISRVCYLSDYCLQKANSNFVTVHYTSPILWDIDDNNFGDSVNLPRTLLNELNRVSTILERLSDIDLNS